MQERLKNIDQQIKKNYQLLAEWEKKEMYADNPTERMQSQEEITLIKERIETFQKEKRELLIPQRQQNVIISCDSKSPDLDLARELRNQLEEYGHYVFLAESRLKGEENWYERMLDELTKSDYFVLLLSERSLVSEMVTEEVKRARELRLGRPSKKPLLLTVRVNLRLDEYFNFNLAGYLESVYESDWTQAEDSPAIIQDVSFLINNDVQEIKKSARLPSNPNIDYIELPSPNAPLELPSGSVALDSPFYIEREIDRTFKEEILKDYVLIKIKGPRQFGKTSLLSRLIDHARKNEHEIIAISLQQITRNTLTDLNEFLLYFCLYASEELDVKDETEDRWNPRRDAKHNCRVYFQNYLLKKVKKKIVLAVDEADRLFKYRDVSNDFFGLLRNWHELGKSHEDWKRVKIIIAHSTGEQLAIDDINQSPFNVGSTALLEEFSTSEIAHLLELHGLKWSEAMIERFADMIGGHPYLVRKGLYEIASQNMSLDDFLKSAADDDGVYADHLSHLLWFLKKRKDLADTMKEVILHQTTSDFLNCEILRGVGLIKGSDPNYNPSFKLYAQYLENKL